MGYYQAWIHYGGTQHKELFFCILFFSQIQHPKTVLAMLHLAFNSIYAANLTVWIVSKCDHDSNNKLKNIHVVEALKLSPLKYPH